jgi:hypothetical protein
VPNAQVAALQVSNTDQVLAYVREQHRMSGCRYFSFGIGRGVSRALVNGLASEGMTG